jgi:hypothetical protein
MTNAVMELVTKGAPVFLDQNTESFDGSEVRIQQDLSSGTNLSCAIPAITTNATAD